MKVWQLKKTDITINPESEVEADYTVPATQEQIEALGKVVVGEAWMTSQPYQMGPAVIKFAPPYEHVGERGVNDLWLWEKCYSKIIIIAEREETASLALPLPGANPHLKGGGDAIRQAVKALCEQLKQVKYLRHLHIYAVDEDDALKLFKMFS